MGDLYPTTDVSQRTQDTDKVEGRIQGLDGVQCADGWALASQRDTLIFPETVHR